MFEHIKNAMADYEVILEPDQNTPEWWAGAPSILLDDDGTFYMATRMREGDSKRGVRGYENRILKSDDGKSFETIAQMKREEVGIPGFERPALVKVPETGKYRLYFCSGIEGGWSILRFEDADDPSAFDPRKWKVVLKPEQHTDVFSHLRGYKDPFIFNVDGLWHMFVIGQYAQERMYHFASEDGDEWARVGEGPAMENVGWHNFFTRPACVVPMDVGFLVVYEGSSTEWRDPDYNIATGLAYSPDLRSIIDLTPREPLLKSTTPGDYHTWRYSHWVKVGGEMYAYFEASRPNTTNEIRLGVFPLGTGFVKD